MHRWQQVEAGGNRWCQAGRRAGRRPPFPTESGSDAAANPETRREMKRIHFLPERNLAGGKVWGLSAGQGGLGPWLGPPAASGPVRMLWFVV